MKILLTSIILYTFLKLSLTYGIADAKPICTPQNAISKDSIAITTLVRKLYKWHASEKPKQEFQPVLKKPNDSMYSGIDRTASGKRELELKQTGFFTDEFIQRHRTIAAHLDATFRKGDFWHVGDAPPFGPDGDAWCNCQDGPDYFWKTLTISDLKIKNNEANFNWTWGNDFKYKVKAIKRKGKWKISYLEGFDLKYYRVAGLSKGEN